MKKMILLIILDGWGYRTNPDHNAIAKAHTPHWDRCWDTCPNLLLSASHESVGLPPHQMGNSEVGHLHMGSGRRVPQDLMRINEAIQSGRFEKNPALCEAIRLAKRTQKAIHLVGLLSEGGVHSHLNHIASLANFIGANHLPNCYLHAILDGRDTAPKSALSAVHTYESLRNSSAGKIVSVIGRYYAMDRDKNWDRTQAAYDLITLGKDQKKAEQVNTAIQAAYEAGQTDEFVEATRIVHDHSEDPITLQDGDILIFMNFRSDRMRQLAYAFTQPDFRHFERQKVPHLSHCVTLTSYHSTLPVSVAFQAQSIPNTVGQWLEKHHLKQLRIAETEKYAHVTFFFNGGREHPFEGEDRLLIPSPKVATYDLKPAMSTVELTEALIKAIASRQYDALICNYAAPDMVGHTGNFEATVAAIRVLDQCLGQLFKVLKQNQGEALITADHGNAEYMYDPKTQQPHTAHTEALVPCMYVGHRNLRSQTSQGSLQDIGPTFLTLLGLNLPPEMTGHCLFTPSPVPSFSSTTL